MRKYVFSLLILLMMITPVFAGNFVRMNEQSDIKTYVSINSGSTTTCTNVATTTIIPGRHRIIGYEVAPNVSGAGTVTVALYDATAVTAATLGTYDTAGDLFAESASANTASAERSFPYPKKLDTGLSIFQGAGTVVTIFYERYSP